MANPETLSDYSNVDLEVRRTASGGFGSVFMGPNRLRNGAWCVLKTIKPEVLAHASGARELFLREALVWVGLWPHANVLTAQFVTEINGQPFLVLDYADSGNLRTLLARNAVMPLDMGLLLAQQIAAGLDAIHTPDSLLLRPDPIVHRDLKPENVLLIGGGIAQLTDFGLSKVLQDAAISQASEEEDLGDDSESPTRPRYIQTRQGVAVGTPAYMAPEQWDNASAAGTAADVYALGIILSELLTGRHPLLDLTVGHSRAAWREAHHSRSPLSVRAAQPQLSNEVQMLYQASLEKQPEHRPQAHEIVSVLHAAAQELGHASYVPPDVWPRTRENELTKWKNWADTYLKFELYSGALERNERALALAPDRPEVLLTHGIILANLGRAEDAAQAYAAALVGFPEGDSRRKAVWFNYGLLLTKLGDFAEAETAYTQALALAPDAADTWSNRGLNELVWGLTEAQTGRLTEARLHLQQGMQWAQQAVVLNPHHPQMRQLLATLREYLARLGE